MMFRKPKVEFFSLIPEVARLAPIVPANSFRPNWLVEATKEYSDLKRHDNFGKKEVQHTAMCPGIFNLVKHGWIMTTWQDLIITTNGDKQTFKWSSAMDQSQLNGGKVAGESIGWHPKEQLADYQGGWEDSLNCVLKIQTPWRCVVPKGYYLLENSVPYSDDTRFTTLPGFYSREYGVAQMNIQLKWHVLDGETLVKAGTPIAHYMLIPKTQYDMEARVATELDKELDNATLIENKRRLVSDRKESKCVFARLFG